jgi:hypothetical protein
MYVKTCYIVERYSDVDNIGKQRWQTAACKSVGKRERIKRSDVSQRRRKITPPFISIHGRRRIAPPKAFSTKGPGHEVVCQHVLADEVLIIGASLQ